MNQITLPASIEARIPQTITAHGVTEVEGSTNRESLRYFASLSLPQLRDRQQLCSAQQEMVYQQDQKSGRQPLGGMTVSQAVAQTGVANMHHLDRALVRFAVEEDLLMHAVGLISFDDWIVPEQIGGYTVECT